MLNPQRPNLRIQRHHLRLRLLDRRAPVALAAPAPHVLRHLGDAPLLLVDLVARLAHIGLQVGVVDQLEPACFACAVFFGALLAEVAPLPPAAGPELVVEVAHDGWVIVVVVAFRAGWAD